MQRLSFLLALLWLIISAILLTLPGSSFPKNDWLDKLWLDKWVHLVMFALIVFFWCRVFRNNPSQKNKTLFIVIALLSLLYGAGMELVQHYLVPYRSFDYGDILADAAGCLAGLVYSRKRYIKK